MKLIKLTKGLSTMVDDKDYEWLNQWKWKALKSSLSNGTCYANRQEQRGDGTYKNVSMHRLILNLTDTKLRGDHIDFNGLNNQRNNLRMSNPSQNGANRRSAKNSSSKYLGVCLINQKDKRYNKSYIRWRATIKINGKNKIIGHFKEERDAALAYNKWAIKIHKEFANLNIVD